MNMKKLIALLLALVLCVPALAGCGNSAEKQSREAAKEIFGITDQEYKKNSEYYDAIMNDYSDFVDNEPDYETEAGYNYDDIPDGERGGDSDVAVVTAFTKEELLARLDDVNEDGTEIHSTILALKKGDVYYVPPTYFISYEASADNDFFGWYYKAFEFDDDHGFDTYVGGYLTPMTEKAWSWPDLSLSEGDKIVVFSKRDHNLIDVYHLTGAEIPCVPLVFKTQIGETNFDIAYHQIEYPELYLAENIASGVKYELPKRIEDVDGIPLEESPRFQAVAESRHNIYNFYRAYRHVLTGEPGESITVGYYDGTVYKQLTLQVNTVLRKTDEAIRLEFELTREGYSAAQDLVPGSYVVENFPLNVVP